jgi:acyl-CoA synthetase (AMP-forming)/AMP-acid ligase II
MAKDIEFRTDAGGWRTRWSKVNAATAAREDLWPNQTVSDLAFDLVRHDPDRILIIDGDQSFSAGQLLDVAHRLASRLHAKGLREGDVISFQLPNWWEAGVINLAASIAGLVVNPIVPLNRDGELVHMLAAARSRCIFVPAVFRGHDYAAMMHRVCAILPDPPEVVVLRGDPGDFTGFDELITGTPLMVPHVIDANAVKLLMYTSGTTGKPKAVLHSHNSIHADGVKMHRAMALDDHSVSFCGSPLTHISGYLWILNMPWLRGVPAVSLDQLNIGTAFPLIKHHGCSVMIGATPFLQDLVNHVEMSGETLPRLVQYICGGAAVPPSLIYRALRALPNCIAWRTFGATETTTLTRGPESRADAHLGAETDGRLWGIEAKVVDIATGLTVPPGAEGELCVRGPGMMLGYADPEDNYSAFDSDGFFRMGDLVRMVEGDHIVCTGRTKDLIIRAGENISSKEIEDVLTASDMIAEASVVAMPSNRTGEAICAFIIPRAGCSVGFAEVTALFAGAGLAQQKTPEHLEIVLEFPKTPAGKVRKDELRRVAAALGPIEKIASARQAGFVESKP